MTETIIERVERLEKEVKELSSALSYHSYRRILFERKTKGILDNIKNIFS